MSLSLLSNARAMAPNLTLPFSALGGVSPYTYSVVPGGAGGTINASTGLYESPSVTGIDTVQVTDSASAQATLDILIGTPIELVCDILQTCLGLSAGRVYLWDQKILAPMDNDLFIAVSYLSAKPFSNSRSYDTSDSGVSLIQSVNMQGTLSIDVISRGTDALYRKEEVLMALKSVYSEQQQELNSFYLAALPTSFVNLSGLEGSAMPYRFNIGVVIQYFITKTTAIPYFNQFQTPEVSTNS